MDMQTAKKIANRELAKPSTLFSVREMLKALIRSVENLTENYTTLRLERDKLKKEVEIFKGVRHQLPIPTFNRIKREIEELP